MAKKYLIHDNGARPFMVEIKKDFINIYKYRYGEDTDEEEDIYDEIIHTIESYERVFVGIDPDEPEFKGNSILVKKSFNEYVFIGWEIYSFKTNDEIIDYVSPVGNSDVPYPYAKGKKYTYIMLDYIKILNDYLVRDDPYMQYYDGALDDRHKFVEFNKKIIIPRSI